MVPEGASMALECGWEGRGSRPLLKARAYGHSPRLPLGCWWAWISAGGIWLLHLWPFHAAAFT